MNRRGAVKAALLLVVAANALIVVIAMSRSDDQTELVDADTVALTLIDEGAEPREILRFGPEPDSVMHTLVAVRGQSRLSVPDESPVVEDLPHLELDGTSTVANAEIDHITIEMRATGYRLVDRDPWSEGELEVLDEELPKVIDTASETKVVDARGVVARGSAESANDPRFVLGYMPATYTPAELYPFPVDAVGVGARWQTRSRLSGGVIGYQPLEWDVTAHIELVDLQTDRAVADIHYEASLLEPDRPLADGSQILSGDQTFTGSVTWYFDHPGALVSGEGTFTGRMLTDLEGRQVTVEVEQSAELNETRTG